MMASGLLLQTLTILHIVMLSYPVGAEKFFQSRDHRDQNNYLLQRQNANLVRNVLEAEVGILCIICYSKYEGRAHITTLLVLIGIYLHFYNFLKICLTYYNLYVIARSIRTSTRCCLQYCYDTVINIIHLMYGKTT